MSDARAAGTGPGRRDPEATAGGASPSDVRELLMRGEVTVQGRFAGSSNITLLVSCAAAGEELLAVYKPLRGERPLWDFPSGLHRRETAAYELDALLGFGRVPVTVLREDGPFGPGSFQLWVDSDEAAHYFTIRDEDRWQLALRQIAAFDVVANNADRKSGHVLVGEESLWAIDHGLTFHEEDKLRTVIWDFAAYELDGQTIVALERLTRDGPTPALRELLVEGELEALTFRAAVLLASRKLPQPDSDRPYPWPLV